MACAVESRPNPREASKAYYYHGQASWVDQETEIKDAVSQVDTGMDMVHSTRTRTWTTQNTFAEVTGNSPYQAVEQPKRDKETDKTFSAEHETTDSLRVVADNPSRVDLNRALLQFGRKSSKLKLMCDTICCKIKESSSDIKHVWPGYKVTGETLAESIKFVAVTANGNPGYRNILGFDVLFCKENTCNDEGQIVMNSQRMKEKPFTRKELKQLQQCLSKNSSNLMSRHSNIEIVTACSVKSKHFIQNNGHPDLSDKTCIVLYVHVKGIVPLQEEVFPKQIWGFPVDVREGCFMLCGGPDDYHDHLKMGCAIGRDPRHSIGKSGTLGAFIEHNGENFCLTAGHVLLTGNETEEIKNAGGRKTYYSSSIGVHQPVRYPLLAGDRFGELFEAYYDTGGEHNTGVDFAVVKINDRHPVSGDFPDGNFEHAGFNASQPMVFNSGEVIDSSALINNLGNIHSEVVKYGSGTGVTRGVFALDGTSVRKTNFSFLNDTFAVELHKQIEVHKIGQSKFATYGDSGALVFGFPDSNRAHVRPVGIIIGLTTYGSAIVTPISAILEKLGVKQLKCFSVHSMPSSSQPDVPTTQLVQVPRFLKSAQFRMTTVKQPRKVSLKISLQTGRGDDKQRDSERASDDRKGFAQPSSNEVNASLLHKFEYLFFIELRYATGHRDINSMIKEILLMDNDDLASELTCVIENEPEKCLVILDGLDEWAPPKGSPPASHVTRGLPGRNLSTNWTVLTTTRPWKLELIRPESGEMDQLIELSDLTLVDRITSVVQYLNDRFHMSKSAEICQRDLNTKQLKRFITSPLLLNMLICVWFNEGQVGEFICDIYAGIIDLFLRYSEQRQHYSHVLTDAPSDSLPDCLNKRDTCRKYTPELYSLSKLAFYTLFCEDHESTMVFNSTATEIHNMSEAETDMWLNVGLLSQDIADRRSVTTNSTQLSFAHKSLQEFLAAVYISVRADESTIKRISDMSRTQVDRVMEIAQVFRLVSEMQPSVYTNLSEHIPDIQKYCISTEHDDDDDVPIEIRRLDANAVMLYKKAMKEGTVLDHNIRIMIIGHYGVGKTTLTRRLLGQPTDDVSSTEGIEVHPHSCQVTLKDFKWEVVKQDEQANRLHRQTAKLLKDHCSNQQQKTIESYENNMDIDHGSTDSRNELGNLNSEISRSSQMDIEAEKQIEDESNEKTDPQYEGKSDEQPEGDSDEQPEGKSDEQPEGKSKEVETDDADIKMDIKNSREQMKLNLSDEADVSIWDFAGHQLFYETHHIFLSPRSVYLLVTDISRDVNDTVVGDNCFLDSRGAHECKVKDFIEFWINTIQNRTSSEGPKKPRFIFVSTHRDKLSDENKEGQKAEYFMKFYELSAVRKNMEHIAEKMFALDKTLEDDPELSALKEEIVNTAKQQPYWGKPKPAKWLKLEHTLSEWRHKVIERSKVLDKGKLLPVPFTTEDVDLFLRYHHELGTIIYYSDPILRDHVLLEPQWLVDALKCIVTFRKERRSRLRNSELQEKLTEFENTAILDKTLIDAMWNVDNKGYFQYREYLICLMEKLDLLAKLVHHDTSNTEEESAPGGDPSGDKTNGARQLSGDSSAVHDTGETRYLVPCQLNEEPPLHQLPEAQTENSSSTQKLCLESTKCPFSESLFNKLLAMCASKWKIAEYNGKLMIFCGCGIFEIDSVHRLTVFFREHVIQLWVTRYGTTNLIPEHTVCKDVYDAVKLKLSTHTEIKESMKCPRIELTDMRGRFKSSELTGYEIPCHKHEGTHILKCSDMRRGWLEDPGWGNGDENRRHRVKDEDDNLSYEDFDGREYYTTAGKEGYLLILNSKDNRKGTHADVDNLNDFFRKKLNFTVEDPREKLHEDFTLEQLKTHLEKVKNYMNKEAKRFYCFVCVILSHGSKDGILTRDKKYLSTEKIREMFNNKNMCKFAGRPKLFFIQACMGDKVQGFVEVDVEADCPAPPTIDEDDNKNTYCVPTDADTLMAYATTPGYTSYLNQLLPGTYFIHTLIEVFTERYGVDHVEDMLTTVKDKLAKRTIYDPQGECGTKQMPCTWSTLTKRLSFDKK